MMRSAFALAALALTAHAAPEGVLRATGQPKICETTPGVWSQSGRFELGSEGKAYFFWAFQARTMAKDAPTILWMTGGPGCSSSLAVLVENGPCKVNKDGATTTLNPYSWNEAANVIYIDQPAGVGFSKGKMDDKNEAMVSDDMYLFLQAFFAQYPEWNTRFFVFGESYGGHYAPATANRVYRGMKAGEGIRINLAGLAVGNGLTQPEVQYKYYPEMAYNYSIAVQGHPVISLQEYEKAEAAVPGCLKAIDKCNKDGAFSGFMCTIARATCDGALVQPYYAKGLNPYDVSKKCEVKPLCYDFSAENKFMNSAAVQRELGVESQTWQSCNTGVNVQFAADWMHNFEQTIPPMLEDGVRVLIYAGDMDFVCNWIGNKAWTVALPWSGKDAFNVAADAAWPVGADGKGAGRARTHKGLTFLQVYGAGHMVPFDKPAESLRMVNEFISADGFAQ